MQDERYVTGLDGEGNPIIVPVRVAVDEALKYISNLPLDGLQRWKQLCLDRWREEIKEQYGESRNPHLERFRKQLHREISRKKNFEGTTPLPNPVLRTAPITPQYLLDWNTSVVDDNAEKPVVEFAKGWEATLSRKDVGYILDAIGTYVAEYFENGGTTGHMSLEEKYYVIRDTFSAFCDRAGIKGELRKEVKEALFPGKGLAGPLERVKLKFPDPNREGKMMFATIRFVSAREIYWKKRTNALLNEGDTVSGFEMDIHAKLFEFLEQKESIMKGKGKGCAGTGYQTVPKAINQKIDNILQTVRTSLENGASIPKLHGMRRGELEKYRQALLYIIDKWNTGLQNRKEAMYVGWGELSTERGILPKHTKRKRRRWEDMEALHMLCQRFMDVEEAFEGCGTIELKESLTLRFTLSNEGGGDPTKPRKSVRKTPRNPVNLSARPHETP